jgi:hypothetical protein
MRWKETLELVASLGLGAVIVLASFAFIVSDNPLDFGQAFVPIACFGLWQRSQVTAL